MITEEMNYNVSNITFFQNSQSLTEPRTICVLFSNLSLSFLREQRFCLPNPPNLGWFPSVESRKYKNLLSRYRFTIKFQQKSYLCSCRCMATVQQHILTSINMRTLILDLIILATWCLFVSQSCLVSLKFFLLIYIFNIGHDLFFPFFFLYKDLWDKSLSAQQHVQLSPMGSTQVKSRVSSLRSFIYQKTKRTLILRLFYLFYCSLFHLQMPNYQVIQ